MPYYSVQTNEHGVTWLSVLSYLPCATKNTTVVHVSDEEQRKIDNNTHYFDVSSKSVKPSPPATKQTKSLFPKPKKGTFTVALGNAFCPWEDEGTVEFLWEKGEENGNLVVLNNTDSTILCTASSNIGSFSEVKVKPQTKYFTKASHCSVPIGLLTFRESI